MKNNSVIEKIEKLLALANSSNENEAKLAAQRAQELLVKYNLTTADINIDGDTAVYDFEFVDTGRISQTPEAKFIGSILNQFFFVTIITRRQFSEKIQRRGHTYRMFGKPHNIAVAKYVESFLTESFRNLFREYKRMNVGVTEGSRQSFYYGLYTGLCEQLEMNQKKVEQQVGLVVVDDHMLKKYVEENCKNLKYSNARVKTHDEHAKSSGHEQGKNLKIARGLESQSTNTALKIGGR